MFYNAQTHTEIHALAGQLNAGVVGETAAETGTPSTGDARVVCETLVGGNGEIPAEIGGAPAQETAGEGKQEPIQEWLGVEYVPRDTVDICGSPSTRYFRVRRVLIAEITRVSSGYS